MKKAIYILGAYTIIQMSFALLFKILHWSGGNVMLLVSCGILIPLTVILATIYLCREDSKEKEN
jgi:hypothetical protein